MPKLAKITRRSTLWILALLLLLPLTACQPEDPVQRVTNMRAKYVVQVNPRGLIATPHEEPQLDDAEMDNADMDNADMEVADGEIVDEVVVEGETPGAADDMNSDETTEGEETAPAEPTGYDVLLDILLQNNNNEVLPQLTLDIVQTDRSENEIARFYHTVDTSQLLKGMDTQLSHKLEDIAYDPANHMFYVEVRSNVPASEYPLYPEFPAASGSE